MSETAAALGGVGTTATHLSATYSSPDSAPFTVAERLPAVAASSDDNDNGSGSGSLSLEDKTAYLKQLREAILSVQDQVNKELTQRMDEDKAKTALAHAGKSAVDDAAAEENYGEEAQGEE